MKEQLRYCMVVPADPEKLALRAKKEAAMQKLYNDCMDRADQMDQIHFAVFHDMMKKTAQDVLEEMNLPLEKEYKEQTN